MLDKKHEYTKPGIYNVKISNVLDFLPLKQLKEITEDDFTSNCAEDGSLNHLQIAAKLQFNDNPISSVKYGMTSNIINYAGFAYSSSLKKFDFKNISDIEEYAFYNCTKLGEIDDFTSYSQPSIEFSNNLKHIGKYAFYGCSSLRTVIIPKSVESIGYGAFYGCKNLRLIIFEGRTIQQVLADFSLNLIISDNNYCINNITSTEGTILCSKDVDEQQLEQVIVELDTKYITPGIAFASNNASEYSDDDTPPCPSESGLDPTGSSLSENLDFDINISSGLVWFSCKTGDCEIPINLPPKPDNCENMYCSIPISHTLHEVNMKWFNEMLLNYNLLNNTNISAIEYAGKCNRSMAANGCTSFFFVKDGKLWESVETCFCR